MRGLAKFVVWTPLAAALACSAPAPVVEEPMEAAEEPMEAAEEPMEAAEEPMEAAEASVEDRNKAVVMRYMQEVVNDRQLEVLDEILAEDWIAHNPTEPNGREGLKELFRGFFQMAPELHADVKRIIAEGDLVVTQSHYTASVADRGNDWAPNSGATVDIFRLVDGVIVEHWDVVQRPIPSESVNGNTMFDGGALYNYRE